MSLASPVGAGGGGAGDARSQADVDRLAELAVAVGDHVIRGGEHADQAGDLDGQAGFLGALADGALADLNLSAFLEDRGMGFGGGAA